MSEIGTMPRYLTISDDLQLKVDEAGYGFISKSKQGLEHAESEVETWLEANPSHPRRQEAVAWFERAGEQVLKVQITRMIKAKETAVGTNAKSLRREVRDHLFAMKVKYADLDRMTDEIVAELLELEK